MLRLAGGALILAGGVLLRGALLAGAREELRTLRVMRDALLALEREIALTLSPLPEILSRGGFGTAADAFFFAVHRDIQSGQTLAEAWADAVQALSLPQEQKARFARLGAILGGGEESVRRTLLSVADELSCAIDARERRRQEQERLTTALCLSGSALLVLILI